LLLIGLSQIANAQFNWSWAKDGNPFAGGSVAAHDVKFDRVGNVYVCGEFNPQPSIGYSDLFLAKYNSQGQLKWLRTAGSGKFDSAEGLAIDSLGNVYILGYYGEQYVSSTINDSIYFNSNVYLPSVGGTADAFLAKYDSLGTIQWAKAFASPSTGERGTGIAIDDSNYLYVTGWFGEGGGFTTAMFDTIALTSYNDADVFIAKFNTSGQIIWGRSGKGTGRDVSQSIEVDAMGNAYVVGYFSSSLSFQLGVVTSSLSSGIYLGDAFVVKYNSNGDALWAKPIGITASNNPSSTFAALYVFDIAVSNSNHDVYVSGSYEVGAVKFDNGYTIPSINETDIFIAKFNLTGDL